MGCQGWDGLQAQLDPGAQSLALGLTHLQTCFPPCAVSTVTVSSVLHHHRPSSSSLSNCRRNLSAHITCPSQRVLWLSCWATCRHKDQCKPVAGSSTRALGWRRSSPENWKKESQKVAKGANTACSSSKPRCSKRLALVTFLLRTYDIWRQHEFILFSQRSKARKHMPFNCQWTLRWSPSSRWHSATCSAFPCSGRSHRGQDKGCIPCTGPDERLLLNP